MKSSRPWFCNFSGISGENATLLEVIIMGVVGVFGARTTSGAGMYTNRGGTMIAVGVISGVRVNQGRCKGNFGEDEVKRFKWV